MKEWNCVVVVQESNEGWDCSGSSVPSGMSLLKCMVLLGSTHGGFVWIIG